MQMQASTCFLVIPYLCTVRFHGVIDSSIISDRADLPCKTIYWIIFPPIPALPGYAESIDDCNTACCAGKLG